MEDIVVPLVFFAFVFGIPIVAIVMDSRNRRSRDRVLEKAIEAGLDLEAARKALPEVRSHRERWHRPFRRGLMLMAIGGALLVVRQVTFGAGFDAGGTHSVHGPDGPETAFGFLVGGTICLFLGIALVLADFFNRGHGQGDAADDRRESK